MRTKGFNVLRINQFERAIRESEPGDLYVCSDNSWPRFNAAAEQLKIKFSDEIELRGGVVVHNLTRKHF